MAGAIEGEGLRVISSVGAADEGEHQIMSRDLYLRWHGGQKPGDRLVLGFPVAKAGTYRVLGRFLTAKNHGIVSVALNDQPAGAPIDGYSEGIQMTRELPLGTAALAAGENRLTISITGANPKAVAEHVVGLDYIRLEPQP